MTWAPGEPLFIPDRLVVLGGWIERPGVSTLNLYRPPTLRLGNAADADPWLDHVHKVYPGNADHIVQWLAHRVQRPGEKVNHALVLGGVEGIGKDTLLEPIKHAVGPWNFYEISPHNLLGRFNAYLKSVVLRVSEARDAGELDRYALHDRLKVYTAAPPDVLRVDEKHLREYYIPNCCRPDHHHQLPHRRALPAADRSPALRRLVVARQGRFRGRLLDHAVGLVRRRRPRPRRGLPGRARPLQVRPQGAAAQDAGVLGRGRRRQPARGRRAGRRARRAEAPPDGDPGRNPAGRHRRFFRVARRPQEPPRCFAPARALRLRPAAQRRGRRRAMADQPEAPGGVRQGQPLGHGPRAGSSSGCGRGDPCQGRQWCQWLRDQTPQPIPFSFPSILFRNGKNTRAREWGVSLDH